MTQGENHSVLAKLSEILEEEKAALIVGDFTKIEESYEVKKELIEDVQKTASAKDLPELDVVRAKLKRNQELFDNALSGIRAVAARIADARKAAQGIDTYDAQGNKKRIENKKKGSLEKRA